MNKSETVSSESDENSEESSNSESSSSSTSSGSSDSDSSSQDPDCSQESQQSTDSTKDLKLFVAYHRQSGDLFGPDNEAGVSAPDGAPLSQNQRQRSVTSESVFSSAGSGDSSYTLDEFSQVRLRVTDRLFSVM